MRSPPRVISHFSSSQGSSNPSRLRERRSSERPTSAVLSDPSGDRTARVASAHCPCPDATRGSHLGRHAARWSQATAPAGPVGDGCSTARALLVCELIEHKGSMQGRRVIPPALLRGALIGTIASAGLGSVAWGGFIPGGGPERSDCYTQLYVADVESPGPQVKRKRIVSCTAVRQRLPVGETVGSPELRSANPHGGAGSGDEGRPQVPREAGDIPRGDRHAGNNPGTRPRHVLSQ